ncbi:MAG: cytochrome c nitrite reductase small subunit [bacterium]|jgi:cytochrome c nitrite reductase small subunit
MKPFLLAAVVIGIAIGVTAGIGGYTFIYAKGASYLTNDPAACANCHIMNEQYNGWVKSSHKNVATCNDCHTPHTLIDKYFTKALNGFNHSWAFTTGDFHEPIQITERNHRITEKACRYCHQQIVDEIDFYHQGENLSCVRCHDSVGHMHN